MTNDEIMLIALKANEFAINNSGVQDRHEVRYVWFAREIQRLTREECASLCDRFATREMHPSECAEGIRAMEG